MQQQYSDNPLDKQFRDKLSGSGVQPRGRVWKRIANNLEQANRRKANGRRLLYISFALTAAAAITAVIMFVPGLITQTKLNNPQTSQVINVNSPGKINTQPQLPVKQSTIASDNFPAKTMRKKGATSPVTEQLAKMNNDIQTTLSLLNNVAQQSNNNVHWVADQKEDILPLAPLVSGFLVTYAKPDLSEVNPYAVSSNYMPANELSPSDKLKEFSSICIKGLYVGADAALNNTWLMDKKALTNYDFKYNFTLGKALAIKAGYNFSNNIGIETGCTLLSEEGQDYTFSPPVFARVEPSNLENRVKLTYTQVPVLAKFKFAKTSGLTHHTVALNINAGLEYGILHKITNTVDEEDAEYANFKKSELAVVGGIGYDVYLSFKVFISTGVQVSYSSSLYNHTPVSPYDQFSAPHSLVGGVYLGINYAITGCR